MADKVYPEGVTSEDHVNHDMKMGRFPNQSSVETFLKERATLAAQEEVAHLPSGSSERGDDPSASLAELSAKATPGPWRHIVGDDYYIESDSYPPKATHNPSVIDSGWWLAVGNRPDDFGEANSKFIVALVNAYRSGRLREELDKSDGNSEIVGQPMLVWNSKTKGWHVLGEDGRRFEVVPA